MISLQFSLPRDGWCCCHGNLKTTRHLQTHFPLFFLVQWCHSKLGDRQGPQRDTIIKHTHTYAHLSGFLETRRTWVFLVGGGGTDKGVQGPWVAGARRVSSPHTEGWKERDREHTVNRCWFYLDSVMIEIWLILKCFPHLTHTKMLCLYILFFVCARVAFV